MIYQSICMGRRSIHIIYMVIAVIFMTAISSCSPDWREDMLPEISPASPQIGSDRLVNTDARKVMLLYSAGFNSISTYLADDIEDLCTGWLPKPQRSDDAILVYSHQPVAPKKYTEKTSPVLFRLYAAPDGSAVKDTLVVYEPGTISSSAEQFHEVLSYVKDHFPAKSYGLVFSSHATGYLPRGFYSDTGSYIFSEGKMYSQGKRTGWSAVPVPYVEQEQDPDLPAVKSVGQDVETGTLSYEMDIRDFAEAIPMKLDYILFDACLMGGIEVAYELAGKCGKVGFSQAEVLAEGFDYKTLASHLLGGKTSSDPLSVCEDYFIQYDEQTGVYRSATISLVDCNRLEDLKDVCKELFEKYHSKIYSLPEGQVQRYYRSSHHWFYDLQSILERSGITADENARLAEALDKCILYKGATPSFLGEFAIDTFSGFSMYLPSNGHNELSKYYRTLKWNKATGLVK